MSSMSLGPNWTMEARCRGSCVGDVESRLFDSIFILGACHGLVRKMCWRASHTSVRTEGFSCSTWMLRLQRDVWIEYDGRDLEKPTSAKHGVNWLPGWARTRNDGKGFRHLPLSSSAILQPWGRSIQCPGDETSFPSDHPLHVYGCSGGWQQR